MSRLYSVFPHSLLLLLLSGSEWQTMAVDSSNSTLANWEKGYLDIHHISTGRGDAAYFIFPDGTEMVFDVGDLGTGIKPHYAPLKIAEARPDNSKQPGAWIAEYIKQVRPKSDDVSIEYAVISHFHGDHYGSATERVLPSESGSFIRTGVTELGDSLPIKNLIDRAYPDYSIPVDLRKTHGRNLENYLAFIREKQQTQGMDVAQLIAGSDSQISLQHHADEYPSFSVRNIKSNGRIWSGDGDDSFDYFKPRDIVNEQGKFNENPLSLALEISYGNFDYFTGGDMTGLQGFGLAPWFDVETPVARVVGQVDVLALNHHGNRDATNENFLRALAPRVIVQQSWISDHPGGEVLHRMISPAIYPGERDIFSTSMQEETKVAIGPWLTRAYSSFEGHIVIRVNPGGETYNVFILDDRVTGQYVKARFGPYQSN